MNKVLPFPSKEELAERRRRKANEELKKQMLGRGNSVGQFTQDIWAWEEMLQAAGWSVDLYDRDIAEFSTFVDYDAKVLRNNNPKAFHTQHAMDQILIYAFDGATGKYLFYWEEVHDEAHRNVRDGDEWKGTELYMSVWYSMELRVKCVS